MKAFDSHVADLGSILAPHVSPQITAKIDPHHRATNET